MTTIKVHSPRWYRHPIAVYRIRRAANKCWKACGRDPDRVAAAFEKAGFKVHSKKELT